jgi:hypothetical protein
MRGGMPFVSILLQPRIGFAAMRQGFVAKLSQDGGQDGNLKRALQSVVSPA